MSLNNSFQIVTRLLKKSTAKTYLGHLLKRKTIETSSVRNIGTMPFSRLFGGTSFTSSHRPVHHSMAESRRIRCHSTWTDTPVECASGEQHPLLLVRSRNGASAFSQTRLLPKDAPGLRECQSSNIRRRHYGIRQVQAQRYDDDPDS